MEAAPELSEFVKALQKSSDLVQRWAAQAPPGEASLRALLTVDGISVWDIMAADLALYQVPKGLAEQSARRTLWQIVKPYLRHLKYAFRQMPPIDDSDCARWPSGRAALFLGFTPYIARDILRPLVDVLRREGGLFPVLLEEKQTSPTSDHTAHSVHRHRGLHTARDALELAKAIRRVCSILTGDDRYRRVFADDGRPLWPDVGDGLRSAFNVYASFVLPDTIAVARHILTTHRPAVIVSPDLADPRTRVYTLLGAALGIPTVEVQFGACGPEAVEWRFFEADIAAVWGEQSRDVVLSHGVPPEKVLVTGSPRHDALFGVTGREISEFRERFGVPLANHTVLFASAHSTDAYDNLSEFALLRSMKKAVFTAAAATPGVSLIVKPHPLENVNETRALVADDSGIAFAEPGEDIRALTRACDAFFTLGSASTLDALILKKPTVCPAFPGWDVSELYIRSGAVMVPRSDRDVLVAMGEIAADGGAAIQRRHAARLSEFLSSWVRDGGQGGTGRIVDLLRAMAEPSNPLQSGDSRALSIDRSVNTRK